MDAPTSRRRASRGRGSTRPAGHGPRSRESASASDVGALELDVAARQRPRREVDVGVGERREGTPTAQVHALGRRQRALVRSDAADDPLARDRQTAAAVGKRGIHGADDAVRQDHAPEPNRRARGATIGSRPEDRLSFDRPVALLSLAVLAVLAAGFVTLARRRPRVRRPLPERRRPARRLVARERGAAVCAARARHRRARAPRRRNGRAARDEVGAGRERNRRAGRRHVPVDALDRRPADEAGRGQDSGAEVSRARARQAPCRPRDLLR